MKMSNPFLSSCATCPARDARHLVELGINVNRCDYVVALAGNPNTVITLEGHADERGSREYNLALGERRAYAVKSQMTLLGAGDNQIKIVSYGEERPALEGHDDNAWSKNRRVELHY